MKKLLTIAIVLFSFCFAYGQDAYLINLSLNRFLKANHDYSFSVVILNSTTVPISSVSLSWQLNNGPVTTQNLSFSTPLAGNMGALYNSAMQSHTVNFNAGVNEFKIWVTAPGDTDHSNDTITKEIIALSNYVDGKVLVENYTSVTCGFCADGSIRLNNMAANDNKIIAKFYASVYNTTAGSQYIQSYFSGTGFMPATVMNMGEFGAYQINANRSQWADQAAARIGISPASISVNAVFNQTSRVLTTTVTVNFKEQLSGDFLINAYIIENGIAGTQAGASGTFIHNNVVRAMLAGANGNSTVIPSNPAINTDYVYTNTYTLPTAWDFNNIEVIAYVFEKRGSLTYAVNANKWPCLATGEMQKSLSEVDFSIHPNPATDILNIDIPEFNMSEEYNLKVFDVNGKLVSSYAVDKSNMTIDIQNLSKGIYVIVLSNGIKQKPLRFVKM